MTHRLHLGLLAPTLSIALAASAPADCPADLDGDGLVASSDLTAILADWGACPPKSACPADLDGDGEVAAGDLATLLAAWGACPAGCSGDFAWQPGFGGLPGNGPFPSTGVYDFEIFDFGTGPVLVAGGDFRLAGGVPARSIAAWNGKAWAPVGEGIDGLVLSLATFDDGSGPALYAGGDFASVGGQPAGNLAKWNGSAWVAIPVGTSSTSGGADTINDMVAFDDGSGPKLWITGEFNQAGGIPALAVATWDGTQWGSPGGLLNGYGLALHVHDDGSGPALHLGGTFRPVGLTSTITVARRTATGWIRVGTNIGGSWGGQVATVWDLTSAVAPGTGQPLLVACGGFTLPGLGVAWWNGTTWASNASSLYGWTRIAVATYPGLSLDDLYLSGPMTFAPTDVYEGIARQSNGAWLPVAGGFGIPSGSPNPPFPMPWTFETFDDGSGPRLFAGGSFLRAGNGVAAGVAAFDGSAWVEVGGGVSSGAGGLNQRSAQVMGTMTIDGEERLVVGGGFTMIDDVTTPFLAGFDGSAWSSVGGGTNNTVYAMIEFDEGAAPGLLVAGAFTRVGVDGIAGLDANRIARWDGRSWSALGSGLDDMARDLEIFDDGNGPQLYACGYFRVAGGIPAFGIARWSGSAWENIGNLESGPGVAGFAYDLAVFDDGSGPALHVAGSFTSAGGVAAGGIARFRDGAWSAVGAPAPLPAGQAILRMHTFDDGTGSRLYAGGTFTQLGGITASRLARWDGSGWTAVPGLANGSVSSMATFDDGSGPRLAVGGSFTVAGGSPADRIALLDRSGWSSLDGGLNQSVFCLTVTGGSDGPTLVAGGSFWSAGGVISRGLGWWRCTRP